MAAENAPRVPAPQDDDPAVTPVKKKAPLVVTTEKTPLVVKVDTNRRSSTVAEEVHPLPWFRSPEWARKSPLAAKRARGGRRGSAASSASAAQGWWCFGGQSAAERDVELGYRYNARRAHLAAADDADGFRQCVQLLVALIVVVAVALILMIVLQPFRESSEDVAAGDGGGGWAVLGSG